MTRIEVDVKAGVGFYDPRGTLEIADPGAALDLLTSLILAVSALDPQELDTYLDSTLRDRRWMADLEIIEGKRHAVAMRYIGGLIRNVREIPNEQ